MEEADGGLRQELSLPSACRGGLGAASEILAERVIAWGYLIVEEVKYG